MQKLMDGETEDDDGFRALTSLDTFMGLEDDPLSQLQFIQLNKTLLLTTQFHQKDEVEPKQKLEQSQNSQSLSQSSMPPEEIGKEPEKKSPDIIATDENQVLFSL